MNRWAARAARRLARRVVVCRRCIVRYLDTDDLSWYLRAQDVWAEGHPGVGVRYGWGEFTVRVASPVSRRLARLERGYEEGRA